MGTSPIGPFAAQAIWRVGSLVPHDGKMLYRQREKKITWRWVYQQEKVKAIVRGKGAGLACQQ